MDCKELTDKLNEIASFKRVLDLSLREREFGQAIDVREKIYLIFKNELNEYICPEVLRREEIERQYVEWEAVYTELGLADDMPKFEEIINYCSDEEFRKLMRKKEKQGFNKLILAHFSLPLLVDAITKKIWQLGDDKISAEWASLLDYESYYDENHYFSKVNSDNHGEGGCCLADVIEENGKFGVLASCFVSFASSFGNNSNKTPGEYEHNGIPGGLKASEYMAKYFSDKDPAYLGEDVMLPQEWLALFAKELIEKCIWGGQNTSSISSELIMNPEETIFIRAYAGDNQFWFPVCSWKTNESGSKTLSLHFALSEVSREYIAPRSVVRKVRV